MPSNEKRATESADTAVLGLSDGAVEIAPERVGAEETGLGIDHAVGLERFQHARELALECLQAHERQHLLDQTHRLAGNAHQIGQTLVVGRAVVEQADRQIAKARILGKHGEQCLDHARAETIADDHAVDVATVEMARGGLDRERADQADPFADRDRQCRVGPAATDTQHGRIAQHVGRDARRNAGAVAGRVRASQHRGMQ